MKRFKPLSIYPETQLRSQLETLAARRGRSLNKQILRVLIEGSSPKGSK